MIKHCKTHKNIFAMFLYNKVSRKSWASYLLLSPAEFLMLQRRHSLSGSGRKCLNPGLHGEQAAGKTLRGSLYSRLNHCGRSTLTLQTVVIHHIFSLHATDGEWEICDRSTATEQVWDTRFPCGCPVDEPFGGSPWFLLVTAQVVLFNLTV